MTVTSPPPPVNDPLEQPTRSSAPDSPSASRPPASDFSSFHTNLAHAQSTKLDDLLKATNLTKDQAEHLLASTRYKDYNNLKTSFIAQQLQIQAQDHVQFCLQRLAQLSHCKNPITARLATQDLLHYTAAIAPPAPTPPAPLPSLYPSSFRLQPSNATPTPPLPSHPVTNSPCHISRLRRLFGPLLLILTLHSSFYPLPF